MRSTLRSHLVLAVVALVACDEPTPPEDGTPLVLVVEASDSSLFQWGETYGLATVLDRHGEPVDVGAVSWRSSDPAVLEVSANGRGLARDQGMAWMVAEVAGLSDSVRIEALLPWPVGLRIRGRNAPGLNDLLRQDSVSFTVVDGVPRELYVEARFVNGLLAEYTGPRSWASLDPSVAIVDSLGVVRATSMGVARIVVTAPDLAPDTASVAALHGYDALYLGFEARAMNESGQIVGVDSSGAVLWEGGTITRLGTWTPTDVNEAGVIVGYRNGGNALSNIPVVWRSGVLSDLPSAGYADARAHAVNADGTIVGVLDAVAGRWTNGGLETLPASSVAYDITDDGVAVGGASSGAIEWAADGTVTPLGTPATTAYARNGAGWTVGERRAGSGRFGYAHPLLWRDGVETAFDLPFAMSRLTGINDAGVMIGEGSGQNTQQRWPFVVYPGLPPVILHDFLPDGGTDPQYARDIDSSGRILVSEHLLTPRSF